MSLTSSQFYFSAVSFPPVLYGCFLLSFLCAFLVLVSISQFLFLAPLPILVFFLPLSEKVSSFPHRLQLEMEGQCPHETTPHIWKFQKWNFLFKTSMATAGDRGLQGFKRCSSKAICWLAPKRDQESKPPRAFNLFLQRSKIQISISILTNNVELENRGSLKTVSTSVAMSKEELLSGEILGSYHHHGAGVDGASWGLPLRHSGANWELTVCLGIIGNFLIVPLSEH